MIGLREKKKKLCDVSALNNLPIWISADYFQKTINVNVLH